MAARVFSAMRMAFREGAGAQYHEEFLPAPAASQIRFAQGGAYRPSGSNEDRVARLVSEAIVDALEVIQVGDDEAERAAVALHFP